jgi:hypothetical protein
VVAAPPLSAKTSVKWGYLSVKVGGWAIVLRIAFLGLGAFVCCGGVCLSVRVAGDWPRPIPVDVDRVGGFGGNGCGQTLSMCVVFGGFCLLWWGLFVGPRGWGLATANPYRCGSRWWFFGGMDAGNRCSCGLVLLDLLGNGSGQLLLSGIVFVGFGDFLNIIWLNILPNLAESH